MFARLASGRGNGATSDLLALAQTAADLVSFGPFVLDLTERRLTDRDSELRLGGRALDLLIALIERSGEVVSHNELLQRVWPGMQVDESSLRVHMSALRKALGDGQSGTRFIVNEHGRGYRFVGRIGHGPALASVPASPGMALGLPAQIVRMLGREDAMRSLSSALQRSRLVSVAGPGGIGKSTLAIAWAERNAERFAGGVRFVDLSPVTSIEEAGTWLAASLGVDTSERDSFRQIASSLAGAELLVVLDNCEHLIDLAAQLVEALLAHAPNVSILATSREALRASGETLFRLPGLAVPEETLETVGEAALYPAVELFLERAAANSPAMQITDAEVGAIAELCRRLDGIPLAIELAASLIDVISIRELAAQLDGRFLSMAEGRRTANPRHRSLEATLGWSYAALDDQARLVLNRLAVFQSSFTLQSAIGIAAGGELDDSGTLRAIATLARKSLLQVDISGDVVRYRLLETTRTYALERLLEATDVNEVRRRHALDCCDLLAGAEEAILTVGWSDWMARYGGLVGDARAALAWAFSPEGDRMIGKRLTLLSLQFGQQFPLTGEYVQHIEAALESVDLPDAPLRRDALRLSLVHAMLISSISGDTGAFAALANRARRIEAETGDVVPEGVMARFGAAITTGDYPETLLAATDMDAAADRLHSPEIKLTAMRMRSQAEHFLGRHLLAEDLAEQVLACPYEFLPLSNVSHRVSARIILARIAFLKGEIGRSHLLVQRAIEHAGANPGALCQTMALAAVPLGLWTADYDFVDQSLASFRETAVRIGTTFWNDWIVGFEAARSMGRSGRIGPLPELPRKVVDMLPTFDPAFLTPLASQRVAAGTVGWNAPEVLRAEALTCADRQEAKDRAVAAMACAQAQGALAWRGRAEVTIEALTPR